MNQNRLRLDLAELAEEVTPVDLRDRALRTSRRLGIQRVVATSAAALVVLAAATGTALAIRPDGQAPLPAPANPSVTSTWPPVEVTPTPAPSSSASTGPSTDPRPDGGGPSTTARFGRIFYAASPGSTEARTTRLRSWTPGGQPVTLLSMPTSSAWSNAVVSPDGERVAWVDLDAVLWVADLDGGNRRKLRTGVDGSCWGPVWHPEGTALGIALVDPSNPGRSRRGNLDVRTGAFTDLALDEDGCHPLWSGDGRYLAYPDGSTGRVIVATSGGDRLRSIPGLGGNAKYDCFDVASLSPDGSRIALFRRGPGEEAGDVARELTADGVFDTRTGKEFELPLGARTITQAFFRPDGTLLVRATGLRENVLILVAPDGRKLGEVSEPPAFGEQQIIAVGG
ncbi:hypothetical protein [Micromonospora sp. I033]